MPNTLYSYRLINTGEQSLITVYLPGRRPLPASDDHPSFDAIVSLMLEADALARSGDTTAADELAETAADLFDVAETVARKFEALAGSERLTVKGGRVYLDGDLADNSITEHIIKAMESGEDFTPLVRFYERLLTNPLGHAREALYPWMTANGSITITEDGMLVGYKIVRQETDPETGEVYYTPTRNDGGGIVNGVEFESGEWLRQVPGDVVEMPRSIVLHAPSQACGEGLHIGTWNYNSVSGQAKFAVLFDPRDVVNVPNREQKIRVCRYKVLDVVTEPFTQAVLHLSEPTPNDLEADTDGFQIGDRVFDPSDDEGTVVGVDASGNITVEYDDPSIGTLAPAEHGYALEDFTLIEDDEDEGWMGEDKPNSGPTADDLGIDLGDALQRAGEIMEEAEALVVQAAEDARDALGRWVAGRKSQRDPKTGRFVG